MTRQKSEDHIVPKGRVTAVRTPEHSGTVGGKVVPVDETVAQFELELVTAENLSRTSLKSRADRSVFEGQEVPKAEARRERSGPATMDEVVAALGSAAKKVVANKGAAGPDGESVEQLKEGWARIEPRLKRRLLKGEFRPGKIRRVMIPKAGGGERGLGIPNVIDRVVQEAIRQVLDLQYEPTFHGSSHGFRPGRSCHTAIDEAKEYVEAGLEWVVDLDLEKFFDRVHQQRLMSKLAQRVEDKRLLILLGQILRAKVVMPDGTEVKTLEGVPQGGPLSPLLSNVVLDELDKELERREHKFVRYADDVNIFVKSRRAGERVLASVTRFLESKLRLEVNKEKSAVGRPSDRSFLGFRLVRDKKSQKVEIMLSERTRVRLAEKIRELTPRNWGGSLRRCIERVNRYLVGWHGFFGVVADKESTWTLDTVDAHIRRRLRAIVLKHWKRKRTMARNLMKLGVSRGLAWRSVYKGRTAIWALSISAAAHLGLRNRHFAEQGLLSLGDRHRDHWLNKVAPAQLSFELE